MPQSEPPGPFVAPDNDEDMPQRQPIRKGAPWVLALSAVLVAAAGVALLRGVGPHSTAPRSHSATTVASLPTANEPHTRSVQFETAAATSVETSAIESPITQAPQAPSSAAAPATPPRETQPELPRRETQPELAPRGASPKSGGKEPLGALEVTSNPPSSLVVDGRPLGQAPRVIQVPSGPHTVLFVHPERGRMSVTVNVRAGRTTSASADF
ncbi:MAG TPA: PEGA domain-containing protein [Polyangiaceae bacterium]|nr:PEGA domain-containing protein [Polyangiaceae bacterium]